MPRNVPRLGAAVLALRIAERVVSGEVDEHDTAANRAAEESIRSAIEAVEAAISANGGNA